MSTGKKSQQPSGRERWEEDQKEKRRIDPCYEESAISIDCQNTYGKDKCGREISNAQLCIKFWRSVENYRRKNSIYPFKPPPEEREKIKKDELERIHRELEAYKKRLAEKKQNNDQPKSDSPS